MKSARDEFGPPAKHGDERFTQVLKDLQGVRDLGQQMKQAGVTQDGHQTSLSLAKNDHGSQAAQKNMGVTQGERPALSPCDGKVQANTQADITKAGESLSQAGVKQSAAQQFSAPAATPTPPAQAQGRSR